MTGRRSLIILKMFKVKAVAESTHKIVRKFVLMGGVAKGKPQADVIQRVSLFAVLMTDRESHVRVCMRACCG